MNKSSKIFVAGHRGLVGSAILRKLQAEGFNNILCRTHKELDLTRQAEVEAFFKEQSPEYVWTADRSGRIIYQNADARTGSAKSIEEAKSEGQNHKFSGIHPDDIERVKAAWEDFIENNQLFDLEYRAETDNGGWMWLRDKATAYRKGGAIYADGITSDITAGKTAEKEKEFLIDQLNAKIDQIKVLTGLLPICAVCKKIRDDQGYWNQIEAYIQEHSDAKFSHGICPDCAERLYPEYHQAGKRSRRTGA